MTYLYVKSDMYDMYCYHKTSFTSSLAVDMRQEYRAGHNQSGQISAAL